MMLTLIFHVFQSLPNHGLTNRESSISILPRKCVIINIYRFHPSTTIAFDFLHYMRNGCVL